MVTLNTNSEDEIVPEGPPDQGSSALLEYYWAVQAHIRLFYLVTDTITSGDYIRRIAKDALDGRDEYKDLTPGELARTDPGPRTQALRDSQQELLEMFLSRVVDNFQIYIVDIIRAVLHEKPEILKSRQQQVSVEYILGFESVDDLVDDLIESKVNNLAYEGFSDLQEWCNSKGIPLLVPDGKSDRIIALIALRNLIVHNRGKVDSKYRRTVAEPGLDIGDRVMLGIDQFLRDLDLLNTVVNTTDVAVCGKFGVSRINIHSQLQERERARFGKPGEEDEEE